MRDYIYESEDMDIDFTMDVQVGPEEEIECSADDKICSPIDAAKADAENIPITAIKYADGVKEFFVDSSDVERHAELNEQSFIASLNDIIKCNEDSGLDATNLAVIMNEKTDYLTRDLMNHGVICVAEEADEFSEDDIEMDVQVGPNGEEMQVQEDPQEANPVDAVKRNYGNVIVAKSGDNFFMDVEDVQKCAELNCESVIATLNNVIAYHEGSGMDANSIYIQVNESTDEELLQLFEKTGVNFF